MGIMPGALTAVCRATIERLDEMKRIGQNRLEWALWGLIAIVCAGLSVLQYRWTGEMSRAERVRLGSGLNEQTGRLTRAFDDELRESCRAMIPDASEMRDEGIEAFRSRYQQWASSHERTLFARLGITVLERGTLQLYGLDAEERLNPMKWPQEWETLRAAMTRRAQGEGPPPSVPPDSTLIEFPIMDNSGRRDNPRQELGWTIFEVSEGHLRNKTLPRLVTEYLSSGDEFLYDVSVSWADPGRPVIFSTRADKLSVAPGADLTTGIFSSENGGSTDRRQRRSGREGTRARWNLAVRHRDGSLDAAVLRARTRNFATSFVLIGVLAGAAWALVRYTARSRRLADMQFRFAAGVSHDLRTPLTAIRGAAFNLVDGLVTEPDGIKRYAKLILRNAEELTSMIENVLAFSTSLHSRTAQRRETFTAGDLLKHAVAALTPEIEQAACRIELTVAPDLLLLAGDPVALELAFRNLIGNAVRHAAKGKWIGVSAARYADGVEIRVSDRGPGIPEGERERIFEPFYRGEQAGAAQVRGTGLGLSLAKDTVERHRGTITVHNSPAGGAQFTVHLPEMPAAV
jgi:signal transduction histidine kinase